MTPRRNRKLISPSSGSLLLVVDQQFRETDVPQAALAVVVAASTARLRHAEQPEGPQCLLDAEAGDGNLTAQRADARGSFCKAINEQLRTLVQVDRPGALGPVVAQTEHRAWRAHRSLDQPRRSDLSHTPEEQLLGRHVQRNVLVGNRSFFEVVVSFGPREQVEHDRADLILDELDQVFAGEDAGLDHQHPQPLADPRAVPGLGQSFFELSHGDLAHPEQVLAQPVVGVGGSGELDASRVEEHGSVHAVALDVEPARCVATVEIANQEGELEAFQAAGHRVLGGGW
jgi:hypothetical protein